MMDIHFTAGFASASPKRPGAVVEISLWSDGLGGSLVVNKPQLVVAVIGGHGPRKDGEAREVDKSDDGN